MKSKSLLQSGFQGASLKTLRNKVSPRARERAGRCTRQTQALFTGIVQGKAEVQSAERLNYTSDTRPGWTSSDDFMKLRILFPDATVEGVKMGASIAINGTCLTVTHQEGNAIDFDVIMETLRVTNLGELKSGDSVNYERSARMGDEIGGHNVSGHIQTTAVISAVEESENNRKVTIKVPMQFMKYILPKGFIAIDGCSLTVGEVEGDTFNVYLIPETLRVTVMGSKAQGDTVNIEVDTQTQAIVDTVERYLSERDAIA